VVVSWGSLVVGCDAHLAEDASLSAVALIGGDAHRFD